MHLEQLARRFRTFDRWQGATPIGSGNINDTFKIELEIGHRQEQWLLQRLNHHVFQQPEAVMANILKITTHLQQKAYPYQTTPPIPALDGTYLQRDEAGNYWRLFPYFDNTFVPEGMADRTMAYDAARAYGAFLKALGDFPAQSLAETIPGFHDTLRRWAYYQTVLSEDVAGRKAGVATEIAALSDLKPVFDDMDRLKKSGDLPLRVTHNDTKAGNILFDQNTRKPVAVIDLDTVMPGTILSDFGDMARTFTPEQNEDFDAPPQCRPDILQAIYEGFLSETGDFLTLAEKDNLLLGGLWITGEQALRFLTDYLAGDVYYKIRYPEHNLVRARNQLALCASMREGSFEF